MIISVCGKSGSGKSSVSYELKRIYGDKVIHVEIDKIGHFALMNEKVRFELVKCFGNNILSDGEINRKKLGDIVFNSKNEMNKLSCITWKYMEYEIDNIINNNRNKIIVLDYILLPITKYFNRSNIKILLDVNYEIRKNRCIKRDGISEYEFNLREQASIDYDKKDFDYVIKSREEVKGLVKIYE